MEFWENIVQDINRENSYGKLIYPLVCVKHWETWLGKLPGSVGESPWPETEFLHRVDGGMRQAHIRYYHEYGLIYMPWIVKINHSG